MALPLPCTTPPRATHTLPLVSEKRAGADEISVPGIVLTETTTRGPPKHTVLLAPGKAYPGRTPRLGTAVRQMLAVVLVALAVWHLYAVLELGSLQIPIAAVQP